MGELGFEDPIDPDLPLNDAGLDSLMAVKLVNSLENETGVPVRWPSSSRDLLSISWSIIFSSDYQRTRWSSKTKAVRQLWTQPAGPRRSIRV